MALIVPYIAMMQALHGDQLKVTSPWNVPRSTRSLDDECPALEQTMPSWVGPLFAFVVLVGFIGFAFRQGLKVTPDKDNRDNWPNRGGGGDGGSHHGGFDGHSGN
jgi:hypothetical protein